MSVFPEAINTGVDFNLTDSHYEMMGLAEDMPLVFLLKDIVWKFGETYGRNFYITTKFLLYSMCDANTANEKIKSILDKYETGYIGEHDLIMFYNTRNSKKPCICTENVSLSELDNIMSAAIELDAPNEFIETEKKSWKRIMESLSNKYIVSFHERLDLKKYFKLRKDRLEYDNKIKAKRQLIFDEIIDKCSSNIDLKCNDDILPGIKVFDDLLFVFDDDLQSYNNLLVFILDDNHKTIEYDCYITYKVKDSTPVLKMIKKDTVLNNVMDNEFMISGLKIPITIDTSVVKILSTVTRWVSNLDKTPKNS